jgi:pyruvate dehydrogenase E2 component (dihydrolipoamide acetyltransferase)
MAIEIRLPALGQTADEMEILSWLKQIGDRVSVAEALLVVETDKAQVEVESPEEGILIKIVAEPGLVLNTGDLIAYLGEEGETI